MRLDAIPYDTHAREPATTRQLNDRVDTWRVEGEACGDVDPGLRDPTPIPFGAMVDLRSERSISSKSNSRGTDLAPAGGTEIVVSLRIAAGEADGLANRKPVSAGDPIGSSGSDYATPTSP